MNFSRCLLLLLLFFLPATSISAQVRVTSSLDSDWRFFKGDVPDAHKPEISDAEWRQLDVPHDWSIEGPFSKDNPTGRGGGFLPAGIGWYRKQFAMPAGQARKRVFVEFDGVMANSDVWINGEHLGKRPYGYVSFRYELTSHIKFGGPQNLLAVRVDNSGQPASRWYAGAGIYRPVRLVVTDQVYVDHWGTFVTTPSVTKEQAQVRVESKVVNALTSPRRVSVQFTLLNPDGKPAGQAETKIQVIPGAGTAAFSHEFVVKNPKRWDIEHPRLYRAVAKVRVSNTALDDDTVTFGIREARFEAESGFWLNGRNLKLKGVCLHHDASALGAAVPIRAWERRLEILRDLGVNAVRTAHNPPSPQFLALTDRMGFLVMDETFDTWTVKKNPYDYHLYFEEWSKIDTRDTVLRDRNHPSVIIYSTGNEIRDTPKTELAKRILGELVTVFHEHDPSRPVTQALFRPNVSKDYDNGLADMLDVVGQNYRENEILAAHTQKPTRKILGTENTHTREAWLALRDNAPYAGQFLWSGIDYLGESPGWPLVAFNFGLLDRTGTPRPLAFQRQSWWSSVPMVHITRRVASTPGTPTDPGYAEDRRPQVLFSDWSPKDTARHDENVEVYSNVEQVELFLNNKSLGAKPRPLDDSPRIWKVRYESGTLRAVASQGGKIVASDELRTAGKSARIVLSSDRARLSPLFDDVAYITATVVDSNGVIVPTASDSITFSVNGAGRIVAVDSGDNASHEPFQANSRRAYQGRCIVIVRATSSQGRIDVRATAPGLNGAPVAIIAAPSPSNK